MAKKKAGKTKAAKSEKPKPEPKVEPPMEIREVKVVKEKTPRKSRKWTPTAFNIQKGSHFTITLNDGRRTGPTLSFGGGRQWRCVQDRDFEQVLWNVANQKDENKTVRTGPTKRVKLANGQHKYIPDMKKIQKMYPEDFIEEAAESPTEGDD